MEPKWIEKVEGKQGKPNPHNTIEKRSARISNSGPVMAASNERKRLVVCRRVKRNLGYV